MATLAELRRELVEDLQDASFREEWIDAQINKCLQFCARLVKLPALETSGELTTVTTGPVVDVPTAWNYSRGVYYAEVEDAPDILVLGSLSLLLRHYPNAQTELETGDIEYVTIVNGQVFYYPIPDTAKILKLKFYEQAEVLEDDDDEVVCIIDELQELIIDPYVKWRAYRKVEDSSEGATPNTKRYREEFFSLLLLLGEAFDQGQSYSNTDRTTGWV